MKRSILAILIVVLLTAPISFECIRREKLDTESISETKAELTKPIYTIMPAIEEMIPSFDGTKLHVGTFLPDIAAEGVKVPAIIDAGPYYGNARPCVDKIGTGPHKYWVRYFVPRGYAVIQASVRGTGYSGGSFDLGGKKEQRDLYELVEAIAAKPWCNGNVAMAGKSYDGTTPWEAAIMAPPHLKTIVPIAGISDMYRYMFYDGAAYCSGPFFNTYYTAEVDWLVRPTTDITIQKMMNLLGAISPDVIDNILEGYRTWVDGDHDAFWNERDYSAHVENITASVFIVHGLQDWNVKPDNFVVMYNKLKVPKKLWLGQWEHIMPYEKSVLNEWSRPDFGEMINAWMDYWLLGLDNGIMDEPPVIVQDNLGRWHFEEDWPPGRAQKIKFTMASGKLSNEVISGELATFSASLFHRPGPGGSDRYQAVFVSDPLKEEILSSGAPSFDLNLSIDRSRGHLVAILYDISPSGDWTQVNKVVIDLEHRDSRDSGELMTPGEITHVSFEMYPYDVSFGADHRIGLIITGDDLSWVLHPISTLKGLELAVLPSLSQPAFSLYGNREHPSTMTVPVLHGVAFEEETTF